MELISRLMPSPGHTNSGSTNCAGLRWVSRTRLRIDSETRKRRRRWIGNGINRIVTPGTGGDAAGNPGDRRGCQRISGKRRRKFMAVSSVPGCAMVQYRVKGSAMNRKVYAALLPVLGFAVWAMAQTPADPLIEGLRNVEVASVADAMEQLYGQKAYMSHDMRPLAKTKFAGPAVTVLMKKEEHAEGSKASQGMLDAIDAAPPGSVYVMVLENGLDRSEEGRGGEESRS